MSTDTTTQSLVRSEAATTCSARNGKERSGGVTIDSEFKQLAPPLQPSEYAQLEASIVAEGCRDPLVTWDGLLLDGHHRYEVCTRRGIRYATTSVALPNRAAAMLWIVKNQVGRRNLNGFSRAELALRCKPSLQAEAKARQRRGGETKVPQNSAEAPVEVRKQLAELAGVSHDTIAKVERILKEADAATLGALRRSEVTINEVFGGIERRCKAEQAERRECRKEAVRTERLRSLNRLAQPVTDALERISQLRRSHPNFDFEPFFEEASKSSNPQEVVARLESELEKQPSRQPTVSQVPPEAGSTNGSSEETQRAKEFLETAKGWLDRQIANCPLALRSGLRELLLQAASNLR